MILLCLYGFWCSTYSHKIVHDLYDMCEQYSNVFHVHFVRRVSNHYFPRFYRHCYCITTIAGSMWMCAMCIDKYVYTCPKGNSECIGLKKEWKKKTITWIFDKTTPTTTAAMTKKNWSNFSTHNKTMIKWWNHILWHADSANEHPTQPETNTHMPFLTKSVN